MRKAHLAYASLVLLCALPRTSESAYRKHLVCTAFLATAATGGHTREEDGQNTEEAHLVLNQFKQSRFGLGLGGFDGTSVSPASGDSRNTSSSQRQKIAARINQIDHEMRERRHEPGYVISGKVLPEEDAKSFVDTLVGRANELQTVSQEETWIGKTLTLSTMGLFFQGLVLPDLFMLEKLSPLTVLLDLYILNMSLDYRPANFLRVPWLYDHSFGNRIQAMHQMVNDGAQEERFAYISQTIKLNQGSVKKLLEQPEFGNLKEIALNQHFWIFKHQIKDTEKEEPTWVHTDLLYWQRPDEPGRLIYMIRASKNKPLAFQKQGERRFSFGMQTAPQAQ